MTLRILSLIRLLPSTTGYQCIPTRVADRRPIAEPRGELRQRRITPTPRNVQMPAETTNKLSRRLAL